MVAAVRVVVRFEKVIVMRFLILLFLFSSSPTFAQTPAQIRTVVDNWLAARWGTVQSLQTTYASNHGGRYFQGLFTHNIVPSDGNNSAPDNILIKPTDQSERWGDFVTLPATFPTSLKMDVYQNSSGWGYVATVRVTITSLGKTWERSQNGAGTETWRTVAWREVSNSVP